MRVCEWMFVAAAVLPACFRDVAASSSTRSDCVAGEVGCSCDTGRCNDGLECLDEPDVCVPQDCVPGTATCACEVGSRCEGALLCNEGICVVASATDTVTMPGTLTDEVTSTSSASSHASGSSVGTTTTGLLSTSTTDAPLECHEVGERDEDCLTCFECLNDPPGVCGPEVVACQDLPRCETAAACMAECSAVGNCFEPCCDGLDAEAAQAALAVNDCQQANCQSSFCFSFFQPECVYDGT